MSHVAKSSIYSVTQIMTLVILALVPAVIVHVWHYGYGLLWNILIGVVTALVAEALCVQLRGRPVWLALLDGSAVLTAMLLAFALPAYAPWWLIMLGNGIAIIVAKQLFGGLGANPFNPAMVGYAMLLISFPYEMSRWPKPMLLQSVHIDVAQSWAQVWQGAAAPAIDAISAASPLETLRAQRSHVPDIHSVMSDPLFGQWGNAGGEWVALAILLGGIFLLWRRIIPMHIPLGVLTGVVLFSGVLYLFAPQHFASPLFQLVNGATMLGAFFIATDPVTGPASRRAQFIYALGIGVMLVIIRSWGNYPDGVAFAVLIMNMTVPLLDRYVQPVVYGTAQSMKSP